MEILKENKKNKELLLVIVLSLSLIVPGILNALINFSYKQLIIGSIVNCALFLTHDIYNNENNKINYKVLLLATLPSLTNILTGILFTGFQKYTALLIPFIWIGNIVLVKTNNKIIGLVLKVCTIYLGFLLMSNLFNYPNMVKTMLNTSMGITQVYTGVIGLISSSLIFKILHNYSYKK